MQSEEQEKPAVERSSSFARSFYTGPANPGGGGAPPNNKFPVPKARTMGRRQSSRRLGDGPPVSSSLQAAAAFIPESEPLDDGFKKPLETEGVRANSWYAEALQQGGSKQDLDNILATTAPVEEPNQGVFGGFGDEEVLEQYRIMAHHEANLRVKENTGFDIAEYEKRRKLQGAEPTDKKGLYGGGKKPKIRLPDPKKFISSSSTPKPEEPPLPTPKLNKKFLKQDQPFIPELCPGFTVRGGATIPNDEHIVRCLGCRGQLRVKILATLVNCPDCNTVSPASSTRR